MQINISCPDLGFPDVLFVSSVESTVSDALQVAVTEWDLDGEGVDIYFAGEVLNLTSLLTSYGIESDVELIVLIKTFRLFSKPWFVDEKMKRSMLEWYKRFQPDEYLNIEVSSFIDNGVFVFRRSLLPADVVKFSFHNSDIDAMTVADDFICRSKSVLEIDLSNFCSFQTIQCGFISDCPTLTTLNLSGLSSVTDIGGDFLFSCKSLKTLDFSGLSNVTSIGHYFLYNCTSLTELDLSNLSSLTAVGSRFLCGCSFLNEINLPNFSKLKAIEDGFLHCCSSLKEIDLSSLSSITDIRGCFLMGCSSLKVIDLSKLSDVEIIGINFLCNCSSLTLIDISGFSFVTEIDCSFLENCCMLLSVILPEENKNSIVDLIKKVASRDLVYGIGL